jgi:hypothetical protein
VRVGAKGGLSAKVLDELKDNHLKYCATFISLSLIKS